MAKKNVNNAKALLQTIVDGSKSAQGYAFVEMSDTVTELVNSGQIMINPDTKDEAGRVAARATDTVLAASASVPVTAESNGHSKFEFEIVSGLVPAEAVKTAMKEEIYPFSKLEVGQSFFIAATPDSPQPAKSFASTVSSAQRRFSVPDASGATRKNRAGVEVPATIPTRKFVIRPVKAGQTYPGANFTEKTDGARIFRVA